MRILTLWAMALVTASAGPAAAGSEETKACGAKVAATFETQRKTKGWRVIMVTKTAAGEQKQAFDYIPPASMYRKVELPNQGEVMETIGVGNHAWFDEGAGWYEMQPQFALMVSEHVRSVFEHKKGETLAYRCLGQVTYDGKLYEGYRTGPDGNGTGGGLARTIYVDPKTGLPALNLISKVGEESSPSVKQSYSYPDNLTIDVPHGAPMAVKN